MTGVQTCALPIYGDTISSAELKKASDVKPGYRLTKLTDGVNTYDVNNSFRMLIGGLTLYPKETIANRYQIKFDGNGGLGTMDNQAMTYDQKATVSKNKFEKVGYQFRGWNMQKDGQGQGYLADEEIQNLSPEQNGTAILYAQWQADQESATVSYIDDTTNRILSIDQLSGLYETRDDYATKSTIADYLNQGYLLVSDAFPSSGLAYDKPGVVQTFEVHLEHQISKKMNTKKVSRTIRYTYEDGTKAADDVTTVIYFTRLEIINEVTGDTKYGAWVPQDGNAKFDSIASPTISGTTPDYLKIDAVNDITGETNDMTSQVVYRKDVPSSIVGENKEKNSLPNEKKAGAVSAKAASSKTKSLKTILPKTGESSTFKQSIIGFLFTGLIIIGLIRYKKVKKAS